MINLRTVGFGFVKGQAIVLGLDQHPRQTASSMREQFSRPIYYVIKYLLAALTHFFLCLTDYFIRFIYI